MRYCLGCRRFSAAGPLCTQCGRSFGGRLCNGKKRHLNPPDAQFCGQCGSDKLTEAASFIPFGCSSQFLLWIGLLGLLWWGGQMVSGSGRGFTALTGYKSPLVWMIEKSASVLVILFVFYFLSMFMPGQAGTHFRNLLAKLCTQTLQFAFQMAGKLLTALGRMVMRSLGGEKTKN